MKIFGVALCCLALCACSSSNSSSATGDAWIMSAGTLGGIAGTADGYSMSSSGEVYHWRGTILNHAAGKKIGSVGADSAAAWSDRLQKTEFWTSTLNTPGNMTKFIEVNKADQRHFVQWSGTPAEAAAMAAWASAFSTACASLIPLD